MGVNNALADQGFNSLMGALIRAGRRELAVFADAFYVSSRGETTPVIDAVDARKRVVESVLANLAAREMPEIGVILDGDDGFEQNALGAYWTFLGLDDVSAVARGLEVDDHSRTGALMVALVVGETVRCATVASAFGAPRWSYILPAGGLPEFEADGGVTVGTLGSAVLPPLFQGSVEVRGDFDAYPRLLRSLVERFNHARRNRAAGYPRAVTLGELWTGKSTVHIEPPTVLRPCLALPFLGFAKALNLISLQLNATGTALQQIVPAFSLESVMRDSWVVTVHADHITELAQVVPIEPLG